MARLPIVGADDDTWGGLLNSYESLEHNADGTHKAITLEGGVTLHSGTGVPAAGLGVDNDFYFRKGGTAGSRLYHKEAGAWLAFTEAASVSVLDEGLVQGAISSVNFVGAGVSASASSGVATVTVPGNLGSGQRTANFFVAANDAATADKTAADYLCDGTADQAEINSALSALPASGGRVVLSSGTFTLSGSVNIPAGAVLEGQGKFHTTLTTTSHAFDLVVQLSNSTIRRLKISGPGVRDTGTFAKGINAGGSDDIVIEDVYITGSCGQAIAVGDDAVRGIVRNCEIANAGDEGLYGGKGVDRWLIDGNYFHDNQKCAIDWGGSYNRIVNNTFLANGALGDGTDNESVLLNGTRALNARSCIGNVVANNTFVGGPTWNQAIRLTTEGDATGVCTENIIEGNAIRSSYIGVNVRVYCPHNIVRNNTIYGSSLYGIDLEGCTDVSVSGNYVRACTSDGIILRASGATGAQRCHVRGNTCRDNGASGIRLDFTTETNNVLENNELYSNTSFSVGDASSVGQNVIRNNVGYNDTLVSATPAVGTSPYTLPALSRDSEVFVTGGTVSAITMGGVATGHTTGTFRVPARKSLIITHTGAPTVTQVSM